jgi:hypothetical protein
LALAVALRLSPTRTFSSAIVGLNDGYWTSLDLRVAWKVLGFTEAPPPWRGVENIRTAMLDVPLAGGVSTGAMMAYVAGMLAMTAAEMECDRRRG